MRFTNNPYEGFMKEKSYFITTPYLFPSRQTLTLTEHIAMFLWMQRTKMTWLISTLVMKSLSITMVTLQRAIHYRSIRCMRFL